MSWRAITAQDVKDRFMGFELDTWQTMQNANPAYSSQDPDKILTDRITSAVNTFVGAMDDSGYPVKKDGTVPDGLREDVISYAAWTWMLSFPGQHATEEFKTDPRRQAYKDSCVHLDKIRLLTYGNIESPFGQAPLSANWGGAPKLIMRTADIPLPVNQWQGDRNLGGPNYANPSAGGDRVQAAAPAIYAPRNVQAQAGDQTVTLTWDMTPGAASYSIYRGPASGQELAAAQASGIAANYWQDTGLENGTTYYYQVRAVGTAPMQSDLSQEVSCTPKAGP